MKNKPVYIKLKFLKDTFYKGELRKAGDVCEVDESFAKNFIAQGRASAAAARKEAAEKDSK